MFYEVMSRRLSKKSHLDSPRMIKIGMTPISPHDHLIDGPFSPRLGTGAPPHHRSQPHRQSGSHKQKAYLYMQLALQEPSYEARYKADFRFFEILVNMVNAVNVVNLVNMVIGVFFFMFSLLSPENLLVNMVNVVNVVNMVNMLCYSFFQPTNCWQTW